MNWTPRLAHEDDVPALEILIPLSARTLQSPYYSAAQIDAALGPVFGVDRQLISDGTYFAVEQEAAIVGCGGWSKRRSLFGGDAARAVKDGMLDPKHDAARIRAFFVHPDWSRRGVGRSILAACEQAIVNARFQRIELVATLTGKPLYAAFGYSAVESYDIPLPGDLRLPVVRMIKRLAQVEQGR